MPTHAKSNQTKPDKSNDSQIRSNQWNQIKSNPINSNQSTNKLKQLNALIKQEEELNLLQSALIEREKDIEEANMERVEEIKIKKKE